MPVSSSSSAALPVVALEPWPLYGHVALDEAEGEDDGPTLVNYLVDDSRDGSAEFHEAAVSIQARPEEKLRVGLQFLARDFGEVGNNNVW